SGFAATDVQIKAYFPAVCDGVPKKASKVSNAQVEALDNVYSLSFDLALLECKEKTTAFESYAPKKEEYIQVFSFDDSIPTFELSIPEYPDGQNFSRVTMTVPRDASVQETTFRMDLFLYYNIGHIPYKVTITEV